MKFVKQLSIIASLLALSACSQQMAMNDKVSNMGAESTQGKGMDTQVISKKVVYACGAKANKPVMVTYHFEGEKAVSAEVIYKGKAVSKNSFNRVEDKDSARFVSPERLVWIADEHLNLANFDKVDGNMLYQEGKDTDSIIIKYCGLNKKATAKLNK